MGITAFYQIRFKWKLNIRKGLNTFWETHKPRG